MTTTTSRKLPALLACLLAFCLALTGCGGGGSNADHAKAFIGSWELSAMAGMSQEDLDLFKSTGMNITLEMTEDGKLVLDAGGATQEGTWDAQSATAATFHIDGEDGPITLADGTLTMVSGENSMSFVRVSS